MPKRTGRRSERTEVRKARLDRPRVYGEEDVTSIGVKGISCQITLNTTNLNFEDVTSLISDIIFLYQLA